eukprot:c18680_g1_i2.p1 GENE.c18680_g1_i2~~c18680_g1_i2.p1  ORF type:complete len:242 (+),score=124.33 c18680_g1_i2:41-766(+)
MTTTKVFLTIDIGDKDAYEKSKAAFERAEKFLKQEGASLGLPNSFEKMDEEQKEMAQEMYRLNPTWQNQGDMLTTRPTPLTVGRIVIELFDDVPKSLDNFKCLITGEKGKGKECGKPLHYKGSVFHRIVAGLVCQGGDFVRGDGSGGESIYGKKFNDEKAGLKRLHDKRGIVGMANKGKNSNSSQFYITFAPFPQADGKHVVIGQVVEGFDVLDAIEKRSATEKDDQTPREAVVISDCGVL